MGLTHQAAIQYGIRNSNLKALGFSSYEEYLASPTWKKLRVWAIKRANGKCYVCKQKATQVHHTDYSINTLTGKSRRALIALCRKCHEDGEFDGDTKLSPFEASASLGLSGKKPCSVCRKVLKWRRLYPTGMCLQCRIDHYGSNKEERDARRASKDPATGCVGRKGKCLIPPTTKDALGRPVCHIHDPLGKYQENCRKEAEERARLKRDRAELAADRNLAMSKAKEDHDGN